ncbi:hypothetical protein GCM10029976_041850 [Kribbella albertanoniae]
MHVLGFGDQGNGPPGNPDRDRTAVVPLAQPPYLPQRPLIHLQPLGKVHEPRPSQDGTTCHHRQEYVADRATRIQ